METNTVLLDVKTYNGLRDFKREIEEGKTLRIQGHGYYSQEFVTTEKAIEIIAELNQSLSKEIERLRNINKPKETTFEDIKQMSYWEFRKWRKS